MILVILIVLLTFLICLGAGSAFVKFTMKKRTASFNSLCLADVTMTGFIVISMILGVIYLFIPVHHGVLWFFAITGIYGIFLIDKSTYQTWLNVILHGHWIPKLSFLAALPVIIYWGVLPVSIWDTWMYHAQLIQWSMYCPAVPGLANLSPHLGLHSTVFLFSSLISTREWIGYSVYVVNTFLLLLVWLKLLSETVEESGETSTLSLVLPGLMLAGIVFFFKDWISSPSPDVSSALLFLYLTILMFRPAVPRYSSLLIVLLIFTLSTLKLNNILLFGPGVISLFTVYRDKSLFRIAIMITGLIIIPWLARNYIISGYPFYPASPGLFQPDWRLPANELKYFREGILAWARVPFTTYREVLNMPVHEWTPVWYIQTGSFIRVLLLAAFIGPFTFFFKSVRTGIRNTFWNFFLTAWLMMIFWFFTAPSPRFILAPLCFLAVFPLTVPVIRFIRNKLNVNLKQISTALIAVTLFSMPLVTIINGSSKLPDAGLLMLPESPPPAHVQPILFHGMTFHVLDESAGNRCYDTDIPCVQQLDQNLHPRGKHIRHGFSKKAIPTHQ